MFPFRFCFICIFSFGNSKILIFVSGQEPSRSYGHRLSKPLVGEDGRIYACSEKDLFAFESNGTIAWTIHLDYTCNAAMAPVQGGHGKVSNFFFFWFYVFSIRFYVTVATSLQLPYFNCKGVGCKF